MICEKVLSIIRSVLGDESLELDFDQDITKELDSIGFVTMVVELENIFDIELDDEDFELSKMGSINQIVELVYGYLK